MKSKLLLGATVLLGALSIPQQAFADSCSDFLTSGRQVRVRLQNSDLTRDDAITQIRQIQGEAAASSLCDARNLTALQRLVDIITAYNSPTPPPPPVPDPVVRPPAVQAPPPVRTLVINQPDTGELTEQSQVDQESSVAYEMWRFRANAGEPLQISMSEYNDSFLDTYLVVGTMEGDNFVEIARNDDSNGTLNSRLSFDPPASGEYAIRARSYAPEQYGAYQLLIEPMPVYVPPTIRPIAVEQAVTGELTAETSVIEDRQTAQDLWTFHAERGDRLRISLTASEEASFDTYLMVGQLVDGEFYPIAYNDDRGDGTLNSMLRFRPTESGEYAIRATAYSQGQYGRYNLVIDRERFEFDNPTRLDASENAWMQAGVLSPGTDHYDLEFRPARAGRYRVQVMSDEFLPTLEIGEVGRNNSLRQVNDPAETGSVAEFDAQRRGRYVLRVASSAASSGAFTVLISPAPPPPPPPEMVEPGSGN